MAVLYSLPNEYTSFIWKHHWVVWGGGGTHAHGKGSRGVNYHSCVRHGSRSTKGLSHNPSALHRYELTKLPHLVVVALAGVVVGAQLLAVSLVLRL